MSNKAKKKADAQVRIYQSTRKRLKHRAKSAERKVRHPFFRGLREDL